MEPILTKKGIETRHHILESTTRVVAKRGIEKASVTHIAKHAKVSRALIPSYIPRKDNLLITVIHYIAERAYDYFLCNQPNLKLKTKLPAEIETRVRLNFNFFHEYPHYFQCMMLFYYRSSYDQECRTLNTLLTRRVTETFDAALLSAYPRQAHLKKLSYCLYRMMFSSIQQTFILDQESHFDFEKHVTASLVEIELILKTQT